MVTLILRSDTIIHCTVFAQLTNYACNLTEYVSSVHHSGERVARETRTAARMNAGTDTYRCPGVPRAEAAWLAQLARNAI